MSTQSDRKRRMPNGHDPQTRGVLDRRADFVLAAQLVEGPAVQNVRRTNDMCQWPLFDEIVNKGRVPEAFLPLHQFHA